jgi:AraC-like DNA-binding protein
MDPDMIAGIKQMIARCMERMGQGACATCDNRTFCPAGRWQQVLSLPPQEHSRGRTRLVGLLSHVVRAVTKPAPGARCFKREVEDAIEPLLGTGEVSIERIARSLGMSRQTLYRRLKKEGTGFEEILEAKRRQLAIRYLGVDRLHVKAVSYRLGFSDPAAFSRAFKRWTGFSPSEFQPQ